MQRTPDVNQWFIFMKLFQTLLFLASTSIPYQQFRAPYNVAGPMYLTVQQSENGSPQLCVDTSGTVGIWKCTHVNAVLTGLVVGTTVVFVPGIGATGGTLTVDTDLGPYAVDEKDGMTPATLVGGEPYLLYFDGTVWRVVA